METIGLIAAMTQESDALLRCMKGWRRIALGSSSGISFDISGQNCILVTSGMGIRRAREAARNLVEMKPPRMLISFGIAGAVEMDLQIGDVITPETVCRLYHGIPGDLNPLASWPDAAREAAVRALANRGARLLSGTAVTTGGSAIIGNKLDTILHPILEMETDGIAQVAAEKGIPLYSIRAISDGPCSPLPFDLGEVMDEEANLQSGKMLKAIFRHPGIVFRFRRMIRNTRIAADNAAIALTAALNQMLI
jgi:nucleoside phosphorylase